MNYQITVLNKTYELETEIPKEHLEVTIKLMEDFWEGVQGESDYYIDFHEHFEDSLSKNGVVFSKIN